MVYEIKTRWTGNSVIEFIEAIESESKQHDAYILLDRFAEVTQFTPKMWGPSIIGYGKYSYTYESGHHGEAPLVGFSPRKTNISLYFTLEQEKREELLRRLGKHRTGKSCVYVIKLADIDLVILDELITETIRFLSEKFDVIHE